MREIRLLGKLPDPFRKEDGSRVTPEEWKTYRETVRKKIIDIEFGTLPPRPEVVRFERLNAPGRGHSGEWYKIYAGTEERQVSFTLELNVPGQKAPYGDGTKYPVLLTGDMCYQNMESDVIEEGRRHGYIMARFNRLELANDIEKDKNRVGGLFDVYPENTEFTKISAWAWGYMTCMDVLEQIPWADETEVGITGHSRGGKTVMLAAAADDRIKYVCPNNSGTHGTVSYRCEVTHQGEKDERSEKLADMLVNFPLWMGPKLTDYAGREDELPYDMHYFGALIAPRYYLQCEGMQDYWINPVGAWQNFQAVRACYRYLGCEDHAAAWFRPGYHRHKLPDFMQFMDFMDRARAGLPLSEHLCINPYPELEKNFDW